MIEAEYTITYSDYKSALRLYCRKRLWALINVLLVWVFAGVSACMLVWTVSMLLHGKYRALAGTGWIVFWAVLTAFYPLMRSVQLRRCYRALFPEGSQKIIRMNASDEQLIFAVPGTAEGRYFWNAYQSFAENKTGMILFQNKRRFHIIPHDALNDMQWIEFRGLVNARMNSSQPVT